MNATRDRTTAGAVIFDMDGLLIDSEPLWHVAEIEVFATVGVELTPDLCQQTTGLRIDEVVQIWYSRRPWSDPAPDAVSRRIVERVVELVAEQGEPKPGAIAAVAAARDAGCALALATSSAPSLIEAVVARLGLAGAFDVMHTAAEERYGKPHPAVLLTTAELLSVDPSRCVVLEDSLNGVIAAKAARMACIAVPEVPPDQRARFAIADVVLDSLEAVDRALFIELLREHR